MQELREQTLDVIQTLNEEQMLAVLAYAQGLKDQEAAQPATLELLLDELV